MPCSRQSQAAAPYPPRARPQNTHEDTLTRPLSPRRAYTDKFLLVCSWMLAKKIFNAINKNWLDGQYNATANIVICCVELVMFTCFRPFRDNTVNLSKVIAAATNFLGLLAVALPILQPDPPPWLDGPFAIVVTSAGTLVMAAQACLYPLGYFLAAACKFSAQAAGACLSADSSKMFNTFGVLTSLGTSLRVRWVLGAVLHTCARKRALNYPLEAFCIETKWPGTRRCCCTLVLVLSLGVCQRSLGLRVA